MRYELRESSGPLDKPYVDIESVLCRPFSRGTVVSVLFFSHRPSHIEGFLIRQHINSADPHDPPTIDPHLFEEEIDLELLVAGFKTARKLIRSSHFKDIVEKEARPKADIISDEQIKGTAYCLPVRNEIDSLGIDYVRANTVSTQGKQSQAQRLVREALIFCVGSVGSCAMLPKEKGGVVDPKLRVGCLLPERSAVALTVLVGIRH